jgi:general L-amino acid transport system substrate-binding protein
MKRIVASAVLTVWLVSGGGAGAQAPQPPAQRQAQQAAPADTLAAVRARGHLACGVSTGVAGLSQADSRGVWRGVDADFCRAVAAAVFGDAERLRFVPTTPQNRFTALQSGEVDLLARNTTYSFGRDVGIGLSFTGITLYDGQGFMVRRDLGVRSARELDGATVCLQPGTTTELNLTDWARANSVRFQPVVIESFGEVLAAFFAGRCDVYTTDRSGLASTRAGLGPRADEYSILPETVSREPLGPLVRKDDWRWFDLVKWVGHALVAAEEFGVTAANAEVRRADPNPEVQRLLGGTGEFGQALGLEAAWARNAVRAVGNFAEVWDRNLSPLGMERGPNRLWRDGGLLYAPPFR